MRTDRPLWYRVAGALAYLLIGIFLWRYLARLDFDRLRATTISWPLLLAALPVSLLARTLLVLGWREILLHFESQAPRFVVLNNIYGTAWLARYVPGKIWYHFGKVTMVGRHGVSREDAGLSSLLEVILQLSTGILVGLALILASARLDLVDSAVRGFSVVVLLVVATLLSPAVFNRVIAFLVQRLRSQSFGKRHFINATLLTRLILVYTSVHLVTGLPVLMLLKSLYPEASIGDFPFVTGVVVLSGVFGALALFAPAGLGVRESVQLVLLPAAFPAETVLVFAVLLRAWAIFIDLAFWGCGAIGLAYADRRPEVVG